MLLLREGKENLAHVRLRGVPDMDEMREMLLMGSADLDIGCVTR